MTKHPNREKIVEMLKQNTPKGSYFGKFAPAMDDWQKIQNVGGTWVNRYKVCQLILISHKNRI